MKKNFLYAVIAVFALFFAACSQEEMLSTESSNKQVRLTVNVPGATPNTRANMEVSGYTMQCIMEILDANGTKIGEQKIETVDAATGKATFTFEKPADAAKYLFWANYLKDGNSFYKTDDLKNITYRLNKTNDLFNNAAADAFCTYVSDENLGANVTLKRPFTRLAVKTADLEKGGLTGLNKINPSLFAGTGFSVATGTAAAAVQLQATENAYVEALTGGEFTFYCFVFAYPAGETKTSSIKFSSDENTTGKSINLTAEQMQGLNDNTSVNLVPNQEPGQETTVEIVIDNSFGGSEPETPEDPSAIKVGSYINAAGEVVTDASQAVGIVFALEALNGDVASNYPTTLKDKTIKGYAVAISNVADARQQVIADGEQLTFSMPENPTNGTQTTGALLAGIGSEKAFVTTYNTWVNAHTLTGENLSEWYIPTYAQLTYFANMLFKIGENTATGSAAFKALPEFAFENGKIFDRNPIAAVNCASSTINNNGNISVMQFGTDGTAKGTQAVVTGDATKSTAIICRPMLTIFE